ncbi:MAG: hypothetical protein ACOY30_11010 [Bacillota bacterium]
MRLKLTMYLSLMFLCLTIGYSGTAYAANYSALIGSGSAHYYQISYSVAGVNVVGFNDTQDFIKMIPADVTVQYRSASGGGAYDFYLNYTLPDDGSYWRVQGNVIISVANSSSTEGGTGYGYNIFKIDIANTTPGSFSGYSPKTATDAANTAAGNAITAAVNATNAYNAANAAKTSADAAVSYTWDLISSKSVATLASEANAKLDDLQSSIVSIQNNFGGDTTPPAVKLRTVSGAKATSGNAINAVLDISDNAAGTFQFSLDGEHFSPAPASKIISLPVNNPGPNVITVWVRDEAGNVGSSSITIRKL